MIKVIVFDLSGVVFTNGLTRTISKIHAGYNIPKKKIKYALDGKLSERYRTGLIAKEKFWGKVGKYLALSHPVIEKIKFLWFNQYILIPEAVKLLRKLRRRGIKTAYLSDSPKERVEYLEKKYHFLQHFDVGLFSFQAKAKKPNMKVYRLLIKKLGEQPQGILYIDDKMGNLIPAQKLGMKIVIFESPIQLEMELDRLTKNR